MERSYRSALRRMTGSAVLALQPAAEERSALLRKMVDTTDPACAILLKENLIAMENEAPIAAEQISEAVETLLLMRKGIGQLEDEFKSKMEEARKRWVQRFQLSQLEEILQKGGWLRNEQGRWSLAFDGSRRQIKGLYGQMMQQLAGDVEKNMVVLLSRSQHLQERIAKSWYAESVRCSQSRLLPTLELAFRAGEAEQLRLLRDRVGEVALRHFHQGIKASQKKSWSSPAALCRGVGSPVWNRSRIWESGWRGFLEDYLSLALGVGLEVLQWYRDKWELYLRGYSQGQIDLFRAPSAS